MKNSDPRLIAYEVMQAVRDDDAYVNLLLPSILQARKVDTRESALATELTHGTIRLQGTYDAIIDRLASKPVDATVRDVLRLGAHQLLSMRIPDHAAVDTTVRLTRKVIGHKPAGFVNAIMRRISERSLDEWIDLLSQNQTGDAVFALRYSHPEWIVRRLRQLVGENRIASLLAAHNERPKVTLVARPGLATVKELPGVQGKLSPYAVILESGNPGSIPAVREGRAGVQDEGSQMVALVSSDVSLVGSDENWLDLCAGPGGKAALWGAIGSERGAKIIANEPQEHRAELVRSSVQALANVDVVSQDGRRGPWAPGSFDRVLVDAPCSGLGALRRRPESRWRKRESDLAELTVLQEELLRSAINYTRVGGVVAYATCSPLEAETNEIVAKVVGERAQLESEHRWWPDEHGTDAMYLAILRIS